MTQRLYYDDSYTLDFDGQLVEQTEFKQRPALVLDRTYFYPEGGGQPSDTGHINGVKVIDVQTRESDRAVLHILEHELSAKHIEGQIDAPRRFDYMQHHSGQHVLSQALLQAANADTLSVHMSADTMTIDVNKPALTPDELVAVEELANRIVLENRGVRAWFPDADELAALALRKLPDVAGKVRVIDMGGFDITACGGTHVAHTGEIGLIKIVRLERRGNTTRLEFKCGWRSLRDYHDKNAVIGHLTSEMTVGYWELNSAFARLQAENKTLRSELKAAKDQLIEAEAWQLLASATSAGDHKIVARAFENREVSEVKLLAQKLTNQAGMIALLGIAGEKAQLLFGRSSDVDLDVAPLLKQALKAINSERGGGQPAFAQGGGVPATWDQVQAALDEAKRTIGGQGRS